MTQDERHELVAELAEIIAGLQVPYSINKRMLGAAADGWLKVWTRLHLFGWQDKDSITKLLAAALLDS